MSQNDTLTETGSGQAYRNADKKRAVFWQVIHVTFGCYTADGSDLEFFKQRTIGDDHSKLKERIVPAEYSPAPGEAVLLTSTTSVRNKNAFLLKTPFDSCFSKSDLSIPLPRQARDKHRNSGGKSRFLQAFASTGLEQILKNMHVVYPIFLGE